MGARPGADRGEMVTERRPGSGEPTAGRWLRGARMAPARCTDGACPAVHGGAIRSARPGAGSRREPP